MAVYVITSGDAPIKYECKRTAKQWKYMGNYSVRYNSKMQIEECLIVAQTKKEALEIAEEILKGKIFSN